MAMASKQVTIEDAARYDRANPQAAAAVAGESAEHGVIRAANGRELRPEHGQWVVRYGPGDVGVMDDGEYRRFFGD